MYPIDLLKVGLLSRNKAGTTGPGSHADYGTSTDSHASCESYARSNIQRHRQCHRHHL